MIQGLSIIAGRPAVKAGRIAAALYRDTRDGIFGYDLIHPQRSGILVMSNRLTGKRIVLGVSGGIAAYKSADLVRRLCSAGAEVQVVMTAAAREFITPLTLQTLSGRRVRDQLMDPEAEQAMGHIELARWPDAVLIAPATADCLARLAVGRADDLLSTLVLATRAPLLLAPAMNQAMWLHPATRANADLLEARGAMLLGPAEGEQACGDIGPGRMLEPEQLVRALDASFASDLLGGTRVLITAGPTREAVDPVRYISNHSSGKMGYAVARAAAEAGARVTLISGPTALATPEGVHRIDVVSAGEMHTAVMSEAANSDIFVSTAAVADYRPSRVAGEKQKKKAARLELALERTPDILADVAGLGDGPFTVGFAAETNNLEDNARSKRRAKALQMIAANWVGKPDGGFNRDDNALEVFWEGGHASLALAPKSRIARELIQLIASQYHAAGAA